MSQHLYTSISVFRYWHRVDELTEQKVRSEREAEVQYEKAQKHCR